MTDLKTHLKISVRTEIAPLSLKGGAIPTLTGGLIWITL